MLHGEKNMVLTFEGSLGVDDLGGGGKAYDINSRQKTQFPRNKPLVYWRIDG